MTANRLILTNLVSDPTAAMVGDVLTVFDGSLSQAVKATFNAEVTGTAGVMQPGGMVDPDGNGTYEGVIRGGLHVVAHLVAECLLGMTPRSNRARRHLPDPSALEVGLADKAQLFGTMLAFIYGLF